MTDIPSLLANAVIRGKVLTATVVPGQRTLLQVAGYDQDVFDNVELLQPHGDSSNPPEGTDVLILSVGATRDHKVALGGDFLGNIIANLAPGEFGKRSGSAQLVFRANGDIELNADGETLRQLVTDAFPPLFNAHVHTNGNGGGDTGPPTTLMTSAHLTGAVHAGGPA